MSLLLPFHVWFWRFVSADTGAYVKETQAEDGLSTDSDQLVQMGVALNRAYQDIVAENLEMVQLLLVQNQEKQVCQTMVLAVYFMI